VNKREQERKKGREQSVNTRVNTSVNTPPIILLKCVLKIGWTRLEHSWTL